MIAIVQGRVLDINPDNMVLELGGIGILIFVPDQTRGRLRIGEGVLLYTHLVVRQDALTLYGFETKEERDYFSILIGVSGIGPKTGLSILSTLTPETIQRAVFHEQPEIFVQVPGIGKKTAQKIVLFLQDRIPVSPGLESVSTMSDVDSEVLAALTGLGYSVVEAQRAIQSIPSSIAQDVESRLRIALQFFTSP
jgi:Holliday junction DNA helicase RuvA